MERITMQRLAQMNRNGVTVLVNVVNSGDLPMYFELKDDDVQSYGRMYPVREVAAFFYSDGKSVRISSLTRKGKT